jgi:hypothetical protein
MQEIGKVKYENSTMIPWAFSQRLFASFVDELESHTTWRYQGEAELILLDPDVDFSNALTFNLQAMVDDGTLRSSSELFEGIIRYCRSASGNPTAYDFSDRSGIREIGRATVESLLAFLPTPARGLWEKGRHYAVRDLAA